MARFDIIRHCSEIIHITFGSKKSGGSSIDVIDCRDVVASLVWPYLSFMCQNSSAVALR
jgi:hypothetical protein